MTAFDLQEISEDAFQHILNSGLTGQNRPAEAEGMPELPIDVTEVSDPDLMNLFLSFTEWASYAQAMLAGATVQEKGAEIELSRVKARILSKATDLKTVTAQKNFAAQHPDVIAAEDRLYLTYCVRAYLEPIYARAERHASAISREISRRQGRSSNERRAAKWGT